MTRSGQVLAAARASAAGRRVGVVGYGSVGRTVADALHAGSVPGCELAGVLRRQPDDGGTVRPVRSLDELLERSDLVVEAAGQQALRDLGPRVLAAGADLLVVSAGALADDDLRARLRGGTGARLLLSTGAIGGLDVLRAAMRCSPLERVVLESRKQPEALVRPWMDEGTAGALREATGPVEVFEGSAREAARRFPSTANVAATLALSTVGLDATSVRIVAEPGRASRHVVRASGPSGAYELTFENVTAPGNPRTSWITPFAVLRALEDLSAHAVPV